MSKCRIMETLRSLLSQQGISLGSQCKQTDSAVVYAADYQGLPCLVKVQSVQGNPVALQREIQAYSLLQHDSIVKVYQAFWHQHQEAWWLVMVLEKCEMDLMTEINQRIEHKYPFLENELWSFLRSLVSVCAYMQTQNIAHRDICPQCIALTASKAAKLEGFRSSQVILYSILQTMTGHLYFISPLLRKASINGHTAVYHDAYKSDVYSLGLVMLLMACLKPTDVMFASDSVRVARIEADIVSLGYSEELKSAIRWMLAEEESARPSFVDLETWLNPQMEQKYVEMPQSVPEEVPVPAAELPCGPQWLGVPAPSQIEARLYAQAQPQGEMASYPTQITVPPAKLTSDFATQTDPVVEKRRSSTCCLI